MQAGWDPWSLLKPERGQRPLDTQGCRDGRSTQTPCLGRQLWESARCNFVMPSEPRNFQSSSVPTKERQSSSFMSPSSRRKLGPRRATQPAPGRRARDGCARGQPPASHLSNTARPPLSSGCGQLWLMARFTGAGQFARHPTATRPPASQQRVPHVCQ